jgi:hypothetical protein
LNKLNPRLLPPIHSLFTAPRFTFYRGGIYSEAGGPYRHRIRPLPASGLYESAAAYRLIARTEVNIAPLLDNVLTNCKSELKYFEAAVADTITIARRTRFLTRSKTGKLALSQAHINGKTSLNVPCHAGEPRALCRHGPCEPPIRTQQIQMEPATESIKRALFGARNPGQTEFAYRELVNEASFNCL